MHGVIVNNSEATDSIIDHIIYLYKRFGLEKSKINADLEKYLNPKPPFQVDQLVDRKSVV